MKTRYHTLFLTSALTTLTAAFAAPVLAQEDAQVLDTVQVIGQRAMLESAVNQQRNADTVSSVLTRDDIGQFPDQNVAEAVRRLPGVNILDDQGEGRYVSVRGLNPELNASSLNGVRLPSPEEGTRQVAMDVIAAELIKSVEVKKTLTPDMDADTIGASIEIETTKGFDRKDPFFTATLEGSYNDLNGDVSPKGAVDFAYPVSDIFGISGGISYYKRETSTDNMEMDGWNTDDSGNVFADTVEYRDYDVTRERTSASLSFDWKATENTELYARAVYSKFDDTEKRARLTLEFDEDPRSSTSTTATFYDEDGEINVERDLKDRFESQVIQSYQVGGETKFGDEWEIDYKLSYSEAEEHEYNTQDPTRFRKKFEDDGLALSFDYSNLETTTYDVVAGSAIFLDPTTYEFDKVEYVDGLSKAEEWSGKFDIKRTIVTETGELGFKAGVKARLKNKTFDLDLDVYDGIDGVDYTLADVLGGQTYGLEDLGPMPSLGLVRSFNAANFSSFEYADIDSEFESAGAYYDVDEDVFAAYAQGRYEGEKLTVIGGLRVEKTDLELRGNTVELVEEDATYNGVTLSDDTVFVTPYSESKDYVNLLPSLNAKFDANDNLVFRGAVFASVVRPSIGKMAPRFLVEQNDDDERKAEFGNPDLDPYRAWNFDASVEYYFTEGGVIQIGGFYKLVNDFIVDVEVDDPGAFRGVAYDEASYSINGNQATVSGIEFNYQQSLDFMPGPFDGLLVGLNYTFTDTEGDIPDGDGGTRVIPLPAASKNTYNAMIGYDKGGLELRLTAAYRDEYLDEVGGDAEEDRYVQDHLQIDASAKYRVNDHFQVFADLINITDEPYLAFQKGPQGARLLQYEEYSYTAKFGLRYTY